MAKNLKLLSCILMVSIYSSKAFAKQTAATFTIIPTYLEENNNPVVSMSFSAESMVSANGEYSNALKYVSSSYNTIFGNLFITVTFDDATKGSMTIANTFSTLYGDHNGRIPRMQVASTRSEQRSTDVPALDFYVTGALKISYLSGKSYTIESFALAHNNHHDKKGPTNWWVAAPGANNWYEGEHLGMIIGEKPTRAYALFEQTWTNYQVTSLIINNFDSGNSGF